MATESDSRPCLGCGVRVPVGQAYCDICRERAGQTPLFLVTLAPQKRPPYEQHPAQPTED